MFPPQFIVTFIGSIEKRDINRYSTGAKIETWKVSMSHAQASGQTLELFFPSEAQARAFSQWGVYTQADILKRVGDTSSQFQVKSIDKTKVAGPPNRYTDRPTIIESWKASLENMTDGRAVSWSFPTEKETRDKFDISRGYSYQSIMGTMPSVPAPVTEAYLAAADAAVQREKEAEQADYELQVKRSKQQKAIAASQSAIAKTESSNIAKAENRTNQLRTQAASIRGQATKKRNLYYQTGNGDYLIESVRLDNQAAEVESQANLSSGDIAIYQQRYNAAKKAAATATAKAKALAKGAEMRTIPEGVNEYTIAEGGAEGYYNNVFYKEGTFTVKNGQWTGIYKARL